jgi:PTH1 family peptidyl-tRNA hydrolase
MNLSGESVACLSRKRPLDATRELIVIADDLALPFGKIRLRERGSSGGHNGLKSLIASLRTEDFIRLRVGIKPEHEISDTKNFVLAAFPASVQTELDQVIERCADAIESLMRDGVNQTMAHYN